MKHLYLELSFTFFFVVMIVASQPRSQDLYPGSQDRVKVLGTRLVASEHSPVLVECVRRETKARNPSPQAFRAKSYVIRTLLLCDWSVQQSANIPQTQKEKNVDWQSWL